MPVQLPSILITDDDLDFRETLRSVFEPRGFRTLLAGDGEEAIEIIRGEEVHLVLLDVHMPRLSGLETLRLVKQFKWRVPCILLSAAVDDSIIRQAEMAQAFSVLSKPVSRAQITDVVAQAFKRTYDWVLDGGTPLPPLAGPEFQV
ncbi:MAG TPA: response regulator [Pirellulales bacterium]|jgi:CheY-like chemotaxis protein|nr:response regulator [Pirellulales bacterium]